MDNIFVSHDGDQFIADHIDREGLVVWTETYDTIEEVRTAYASNIAAGSYEESMFI